MNILVGQLWYGADEDGFLLKRRGKGYIKTFSDKDGYLKYSLMQHGKTFNIFVHRHIWKVFNGPVPEGLTVDHIDENKQNNFITNLQLLSPEANAVKGNARHWVAISPEGVEFRVYNLSKFCREHGLHRTHMYEVAKGYRNQSHCKGWKCYEHI